MREVKSIKNSQSFGFLDWVSDDSSCTGIPLTFCDNQSSIAVAESSLPTKKSKHMSLRLHTVKDHVRDLAYVPTHLNRADPLTKPLSGPSYVSMFLAGVELLSHGVDGGCDPGYYHCDEDLVFRSICLP